MSIKHIEWFEPLSCFASVFTLYVLGGWCGMENTTTHSPGRWKPTCRVAVHGRTGCALHKDASWKGARGGWKSSMCVFGYISTQPSWSLNPTYLFVLFCSGCAHGRIGSLFSSTRLRTHALPAENNSSPLDQKGIPLQTILIYKLIVYWAFMSWQSAL